MYERHGTKIAIFGGKPGQTFQYKGMAGNQVLEWADLDSEIKTANLKNVSILAMQFLGVIEMLKALLHRTLLLPPTCSSTAT